MHNSYLAVLTKPSKIFAYQYSPIISEEFNDEHLEKMGLVDDPIPLA